MSNRRRADRLLSKKVTALKTDDTQVVAAMERMATGEATDRDREVLVADMERIVRKAIREAMVEDNLDAQHATMAVYAHLRERDGLPPAKPEDMYSEWGQALTEARYEVRGWCHAGWARCTWCKPGLGRDFPADDQEDPFDSGSPHYADPMGAVAERGMLPHEELAIELAVAHDREHVGPARGCRQCMFATAKGREYADGR